LASGGIQQQPASFAAALILKRISMTKRINWDQVSRQQKGRRQGISNAYDELPPVGSWADRQRVSAKQRKPKKKVKKKKVKKVGVKVSAPN
jgi:hypothetical protein